MEFDCNEFTYFVYELHPDGTTKLWAGFVGYASAWSYFVNIRKRNLDQRVYHIYNKMSGEICD